MKRQIEQTTASSHPPANDQADRPAKSALPVFRTRRQVSDFVIAAIADNNLDQAREAIELLSSISSKTGNISFAGMDVKEQTLRRILAKKSGNNFEVIGLASTLTPQPSSLKIPPATLEDLKLSSEHGRREIPRIIHQVWIGTKPCPVGSPEYWQKWCNKYGYEYKLWGQSDVEKLRCYETPAYNIYLKRRLYPGVVDVIRAEILHDFGGLYVDMDMFPVDVGASYHETLSMTGMIGLPAGNFRQLGLGALFLTNNVLGSTPFHPIMRRYIEGMTPSAEALPGSPAWWSVGGCLLTTGLASTINVISRTHMALSTRTIDLDLIRVRLASLESGDSLKLFYSVKFW